MNYLVSVLILCLGISFINGLNGKFKPKVQLLDENIFNSNSETNNQKNFVLKRRSANIEVTGLCRSNPCRNGGTCSDQGSKFYCSCRRPYYGKMCEKGPCSSTECKNGGICKVEGLTFKCYCEPPYTGKTCEKDPCTSNPCQNGGMCSIKGETFKCDCDPHYTGNICETACDCGSHGDCKFENGQKKCECEEGFVEKNGTCTDCICKGGTCVKEGEKDICKCPPGYGNFTKSLCRACDCGSDMADCIWETGFGGRKVCLCKEGYSTKKGNCAACNCGEGSSCEWISEGWLKPERKVCHCKPGYQEENGKCVGMETSKTKELIESSTSLSSTVKDCHCGPFSYSCSLDSVCNKICNCFIGYSQLGGSCKECYCGPHGTCSFENGQKKCSCKSFAIEISGNCIDKQDIQKLCKFP